MIGSTRILKLLSMLAALAVAPLVTWSAEAQLANCPGSQNALGQAGAPITSLPYTLTAQDMCLLRAVNSPTSGTIFIPSLRSGPGPYPVSLWNQGPGVVTLQPVANDLGVTYSINGRPSIPLTQGQGAALALSIQNQAWDANTTPAFSPSPQLSVQSNGVLGLSVTNRPPTAYDDSTRGYSTGRLTRLVILTSNPSGQNEQNATCSVSAPTGTGHGNVTATCGPVLNGSNQIVGYTWTPGSGYVAVPTITLNQNGGSGATPPFATIEQPTVWNYNGNLYTPLDLTPGAAAWARLNADTATDRGTIQLAVDAGVAAGASTPAWCGGTVWLREGYSTNSLFDLTSTAGGSPLTIGRVGLYADSTTADAFIAGIASGSHAYTSTVYDQCSTNNATGASSTAPGWFGNSMSGTGVRSITFDNNEGTSFVSKFMSLPNTLTLSPAGMTVIALAEARSTIYQDVLLGMNSGSVFFQFASGSQAGMRGPQVTSGMAASNQPDVHVFVSSSTPANQNGNYMELPRGGTPSGSYTDGTISANLSTGTGGGMELVALLIWNSVLTQPQINAVVNALIQAGNIHPQVRDICYLDGDSIVYGTGSTFNNAWARQLQSLDYPCRWYNAGIPGVTMATQMTNFSIYMPRAYDPWANNFIVAEELGINDLITNSSSAATMEGLIGGASNLPTGGYGAAIKALGSNVELLVQTLPEPCPQSVASSCPGGSSRITTAQDSQRGLYDTWLRSNYNLPTTPGGIGGNVLADVDAAPLGGSYFFQASNCTPDGLHPNSLCGSIFNQVYLWALKALHQ